MIKNMLESPQSTPKKFKKYLIAKKNYTVILSNLEKIEVKIHETKLKIDKN
jgi:hypothetical protein